MVAWNKFESDCGVPRQVHSDRGTQLVSAVGAVETPEYDLDAIRVGLNGVWNYKGSLEYDRN